MTRTEPPALVACEAVTLRFGTGGTGTLAVDAVDCRVGPRCRVALTGPSGSGKSSLLHLMAGLEHPTSGTVAWPGLRGDPRRPGQTAVIFQHPSLIAELDVLENVELPLLFGGADHDVATARARATLRRVGLAGLERALPEEISGGQAQRVALARALATGPRLILADEPTGQLDGATAAQVISVLLAAADDLDAGLVIATHDGTVADLLAAHWAMRDGRVLVDSPAPSGASG